MVGNNLSRYDVDQSWVVADVETNSLNLGYTLPWELSYAVGTLKDGIQSIHTHLIRWPNYSISDELAAKVHFDRSRYEREAKPPEEVWAEFAAILYDPEVRAVGHNILLYDSAVLNTWRRALGLPPDYSWLYRPLLDTNVLMKAYHKGWKPEVGSPEAFLAWQYRVANHHEKGLKSSLGHSCAVFNVEYDAKTAHSAEYDIQRNWLVFRELLWKIDF